MDIGPSEAETFWTEFLRKLARRGLRGVKLVISDAHEGIKAAIGKVLHASWQRCRVHFMRNVLAHACRQGRRVVAAFIGTAFVQDDAEAASKQWRQVADQLRPKVPKLAALMDEDGGRCPCLHELPEGSSAKNPLHQSVGTPQRRDQAPHRCRRHLPQRRCDHAPHRRAAARTERRMGSSARSLHEPGNDRAFER